METLPKLKIVKPVAQGPQNISPIPEGSRSNVSASLPRQSSILSAPDVICGDTFRPGLMIAILSFHWLTSVAILVGGIFWLVTAPSNDGEGSPCQLYFVMVYIRMVFWFLTYVQHELIKPPCQKLINQNYNLYLDMTCYRKAPLQIVSLWNMVLIAVQGYVRSLFKMHEHGASICSGVGFEEITKLEISPQMFIVLFCGLETMTLACFYIPATKRLMKTMQLLDEDSPDRTLSNQEDISMYMKLKRQAEQVKMLTVANNRLRKEAVALGAMGDD
ncbi:uncharacterized protein LOC129775502 [Toxorhynchites rutilus septentrionalis]|uniref:uncharacterized protein LOC129775502 n=1 Tax=Toxorhynchites rutilus septentrionalis TaxID=329112 RepID=UPI00247852F7|nr:uncharacterized protein LOC129775502 [Toxorhynchites rutilus septentrionalis]